MIGGMRHRISFQRESNADDGGGGYVTTWETFEQAWAEVLPASAAETYRFASLQQRVTHRVSIRYIEGIDGKHRIVLDDGRVLNIREVTNPDMRRRFLRLVCEEGVAT